MSKKLLLIIVFCGSIYCLPAQPINREAVVERHNVTITQTDSLSSLSVGNGSFAFTVDVTGLQSFPEYYRNGVPLGTQSSWGWHSFPNTQHYTMAETMREYDFEGRKITYPVQLTQPKRNKQAVDYFRMNPHRLQLGGIGLEITKNDGSLAAISDLKNIHQQLDLWTGEIASQFTVEDVPVIVQTVCHQQRDLIAVKVISELISKKRIKVVIRFPVPTGDWKDAGLNFKSTDASFSVYPSFLKKSGSGNETSVNNKKNSSSFKSITFTHTLDSIKYFIYSKWQQGAEVSQRQKDNYFLVTPSTSANEFEASFDFSLNKALHPNMGILPSFNEALASSSKRWSDFWKSGGAVDFSGSTDPRAFELERRIVLSQYLTRIQCASAYPPQETGLTYNSWYGRPHLEMHWWHAVHFALWGRPELMERSLDWYFTAAKTAKEIAKRQGFDGVRWQKMTDNAGHESPSSIGTFLIWQQPHFIYMTELLYQLKKNKTVLEKYKDLVFATADFMASFATYNPVTKKYNLGRGLIPAQERFDPDETYNPTYELAYWHWALSVAQQWRVRTGLTRNANWDKVLNNLAPLPEKDNVYLATESAPDSYVNERYMTDHPAVLGAYASIPASNGLDTVVMKNTFNLIWKVWHWNETWGWDYPLVAMTATRLNMPDKAIDGLLMPVQKNTYLPNGHNYQDQRLTIYLPGNGGILSAIAMMCAGYKGSKIKEPGIPKDGSWKVKWEGLNQIF